MQWPIIILRYAVKNADKGMKAIFPTLTVAIPNYNHGHFLPGCLNSVLCQEMIPDEILIIDDASTDDSVDIIKSYQNSNINLRLVCNIKNEGVISVINKCLQLATGKYILILSADDFLLPRFLSQSLNLLNTFPHAGLCCALPYEMRVDNKLRINPMPIPTSKSTYITAKKTMDLLIQEDSWFWGNTVILNREIALEFQGFRKELHSFCDNFLYRTISLKYGSCFIPQHLSVYRTYSTSYSKTIMSNLSIMQEIFEETLSLMSSSFSDIFCKKLINRWQQRWRFTMLNSMIETQNISRSNITNLLSTHKLLSHLLFNTHVTHFFIGRFFFRLYLFIYYRWFDMFTVVRRRIRAIYFKYCRANNK